MAKSKPRFDMLTVYINKEGHVYEDTGSSLRGVIISDGLSDLERELFASGANTVKFDGRIYKKIKDHAELTSNKDNILKSLTYKLKK